MQQMPMPVWLTTYSFTTENGTLVRQPDTAYAFHLFSTWNKTPAIKRYAGMEDHVYRGKNAADWIILSHMKTAVAGHNIAGWVNGFLQTIGFPAIQITQAFTTPPVLVTWAQQPPCPAFLDKSGCDEMMTFLGSSIMGEEHARLFLIMLRKNNLAWKIFLSLKSNWGMADNEVAELFNDHLNASQIFGSLKVSEIG